MQYIKFSKKIWFNLNYFLCVTNRSFSKQLHVFASKVIAFYLIFIFLHKENVKVTASEWEHFGVPGDAIHSRQVVHFCVQVFFIRMVYWMQRKPLYAVVSLQKSTKLNNDLWAELMFDNVCLCSIGGVRERHLHALHEVSQVLWHHSNQLQTGGVRHHAAGEASSDCRDQFSWHLWCGHCSCETNVGQDWSPEELQRDVTVRLRAVSVRLKLWKLELSWHFVGLTTSEASCLRKLNLQIYFKH